LLRKNKHKSTTVLIRVSLEIIQAQPSQHNCISTNKENK